MTLYTVQFSGEKRAPGAKNMFSIFKLLFAKGNWPAAGRFFFVFEPLKVNLQGENGPPQAKKNCVLEPLKVNLRGENGPPQAKKVGFWPKTPS